MLWPSLTAEAVCLARALEHRRPPGDRLVDDPYARRFLRRPTRLLPGLARRLGPVSDGVERLQPGLVAAIGARSGWFDARLAGALDAVDQVVILGAGYDSRAWRLGHAGPPFVELDHPSTQDRKRRVAARHRLPAVDRVPTDLSLEAVTDALDRTALPRGAPTAIVWEGVTMYLPEAAVLATLRGLAAWCGPGSVLLVDLWAPAEGALAAVELAGRASLAAVGEALRSEVLPWRIPTFLDEGGWTVTAHDNVDALARLRAGRRAFPPLQVITAVPSG